MRYFYSIPVLLLSFVLSYSQESFVKQLIIDSEVPWTAKIEYLSVNEQNPDIVSVIGTDFSGLHLATINGSGQILQSTALSVPLVPNSSVSLDRIHNYLYTNNSHLIVCDANSVTDPLQYKVIISYDEVSGDHWARTLQDTTDGREYTSLVVTDDLEKILTSRFLGETDNNKGIGFSMLHFQSGQAIWNKRFWLAEEQALNILSTAKRKLNTNFLFTTVNYQSGFSGDLQLTEIDSSGEITTAIRILDNSFIWRGTNSNTPDKKRLYVDEEGNTYLAGKIKVSNDNNNYGEEGIYDMVVIKLDPTLSMVWAKTISADNFSITDFTIAVNAIGETVFAISTQGNFPIISGRLSTDGELIYQRGYDFQFDLIETVDNGEVYILSTEEDFENFVFIQTLAKTLPDGTIPSCPQYPSCVEVTDISIQTEPVLWFSDTLAPLADYEVLIEAGNITATDVCDPKVYPTPHFVLPDTICQFSCLQPMELNNQLANAVRWTIRGPSLDTVVQDTSFQRCFEVPGTYYFDHQVWVLGCFTQQLDTLVVLADDLQAPIQDTVACAFPLDIQLASGRFLQDAVWSHGAIGTNVQLPNAGTYYFEATDGYCSVVDTFAVRDIQEQYPQPWLTELDTTLCSAALPLRLNLPNPYGGIFVLDGQTSAGGEVRIPTAGRYPLELQLAHCRESVELSVDTLDCTARIYLPNAFSPNFDGFNDEWFPQGQNFEPRLLQVFDRWGGIVYRSEDTLARWDGRTRQQIAAPGVYLVVLQYYNPLLQVQEEVRQEVVILR